MTLQLCPKCQGNKVLRLRATKLNPAEQWDCPLCEGMGVLVAETGKPPRGRVEFTDGSDRATDVKRL